MGRGLPPCCASRGYARLANQVVVTTWLMGTRRTCTRGERGPASHRGRGPFRDELVEWLHSVLPTLPARPPSTTTGHAVSSTPTGSGCSTPAGYAGINWPEEYGGRGATPDRAPHLPRGDRARRGAPYVGMNFVGLLHAGPDADRRGHAPSRRRAHLPRILQRRRGLVPGLQRARRRLRPRRRCAPAPCATATTTSSAARRSGRRSPRSPTTASCSCAPTPTRPSTAASPG